MLDAWQGHYQDCFDSSKNITKASTSRNGIKEIVDDNINKNYITCSCSPEWEKTFDPPLSNQKCNFSDNDIKITLKCKLVTENETNSVEPVEDMNTLMAQQKDMEDCESKLDFWIDKTHNCKENLKNRNDLQNSHRKIKKGFGEKLNPCLCDQWEYTYDPSELPWCSGSEKKIIKLKCERREFSTLEKILKNIFGGLKMSRWDAYYMINSRNNNA